MTAKEAFKNIFNYLADDTKRDYKIDLKTIKNALNRLEELENTNLVLTNQLDHERKIRIRLEEQAQVLKIIKEKVIKERLIVVDWEDEFPDYTEVKEYTGYAIYDYKGTTFVRISETEFNLLKEYFK